MRKELYFVVVSILLSVAASPLVARAEQATTRPAAGATWPDATARLSRALVGKDITEVASVLAGVEKVSRFGSDTFETPDRLLSQTTGMIVLGVHAYAKPPGTLASDLASDFRDNDTVPQTVRRQMVPPDENASKRADITAAQWLVQVLKPAKEQSVGVLVLWPDTRHKGAGASSSSRPTFVLVKGESTVDGYRITQLIYGDPLNGDR
jgi:hypothetical protein